MGEGGRLQPKNGFELSLQAFKIEGLCSPPRSAPEYGVAYADFRLYKIEYFHISSTITNCLWHGVGSRNVTLEFSEWLKKIRQRFR